MRRFDTAAREQGLLKGRMSELDCSTAVNASIEKLGVPLEIPAGQCWHLEKLKWQMYLRILPDKRRPTNAEFNAAYIGQQR